MAFVSSRTTRAWIDHFPISAYSRSGTVSSMSDPLDVTTWADDDKAFIVGMVSGAFSIDGPLDVDGTADGQIDTVADNLGASTVVSFAPEGDVDYSVWLVELIEAELSTESSVGSTVDWSLTGQPTGAVDMAGTFLENGTTVTVDTDGTAHTGPSGGTTNGAVFHLHVSAFSGFTSDDIIVEGSTSGAFAGEETTIATFTQVTGLTSERVEVTGTVPRYLRVADDVTGTGSITRTVLVSRR